MKRSISQEEVLQRAHALSGAEHAKDLRPLIAKKIEDLQYYDALNMDKALAVCIWGRSGSLLVASYLDGHDNVVLLPTTHSMLIYEFFDRYQRFSMHDKLIAYPMYLTDHYPYSSDFFQGDFPIGAADYYAAVAAICEIYTNSPPQLLETRRAFFQLLHVAYNLALGRRPASPHPLMVYAQHWWDDALAGRFVEDFPQASFLHCVRDPITSFDRSFEHWVKELGIDACILTIDHLITADQPHRGMEPRTRAIRFEDLHSKTTETISGLINWLELPYHSALLKSTFNGKPWVVERAGITWSGPRPEQALRFSRNVAFTDRALLFALFYENFRAWNYSCPKLFKHPLVRGLTFMLLLPFPMKSEIVAACTAVKVDVLPSLKRGSFRVASACLFGMLRRRFWLMRRITKELCRRLKFGRVVLKVL